MLTALTDEVGGGAECVGRGDFVGNEEAGGELFGGIAVGSAAFVTGSLAGVTALRGDGVT